MDTEEKCDKIYLLLEFGLNNLPSLLFFITGPINFYQIRSIGFNRIVKFSPLFKMKLFCCLLLAFINFVMIIVAI